METSDVVSSVIALIALVISGASLWVAKKGHDLSMEQASQRKPKLSLYLSDNFYQDRETERIFVYSFTISNPADIDNSIANCELKIIFKRPDGSFGNFLVQHDPTLANKIPDAKMKIMNIPASIKSHDCLAAATLFSVDLTMLENMHIEKYEVVFLDTHGIKSTEAVFIMKDVVNA